jgi:DNA-binding transcriptional LysR family regulator
MMQTPSLKFLKTFHIAARLGSFKLAADQLCITASAVSHQIKALEDRLGISLFDRGAHSLTLTDAGRHYLQSIDALFSRLDSVTEQLQHRFRRQLVRLQVPPFFATELLLPRLSAFSAVHDQVDIDVGTRTAPYTGHAADADVSVLVGNGNWEDCIPCRCSAVVRRRLCPGCDGIGINAGAGAAGEALIVHTRRLDYGMDGPRCRACRCGAPGDPHGFDERDGPCRRAGCRVRAGVARPM